jgi:hypothetical protein
MVGSASADWLVLRDGARLETKGAWKVDGRRVLFTLPNGMLSTVRTDEVNLDQSALVTTQAREVAAAPAVVVKEKKEPVLRLTEKDIPPVGAAALAAAEKEGGAAGKRARARTWSLAARGDLVGEDRKLTGDGLEIFGTIKNGGTNIITTPTLLVAIYDADGGLLASVDGEVNSPQIQPGKTANFRVAIPGVPDFAAVKFDAQGRGYKPRVENAGVDETEPQELEETGEMPAEEAPAEEPPPN